MSQTTLTDQLIDELLSLPHCESLGSQVDELMAHLPADTPLCERTTLLSWIYQQKGVMSFLEIAERITGGEDKENISQRKKHIRGVLRGMQNLRLIQITNFQVGGDVEDLGADELDLKQGVIGRGSLISLSWAGMVWLRRAWQARQRLIENRKDTEHVRAIHAQLVEEEDEGKGIEPFWVENISNLDPDGPSKRMGRIVAVMPQITSVFNLHMAGSRP